MERRFSEGQEENPTSSDAGRRPRRARPRPGARRPWRRRVSSSGSPLELADAGRPRGRAQAEHVRRPARVVQRAALEVGDELLVLLDAVAVERHQCGVDPAQVAFDQPVADRDALLRGMPNGRVCSASTCVAPAASASATGIGDAMPPSR